MREELVNANSLSSQIINVSGDILGTVSSFFSRTSPQNYLQTRYQTDFLNFLSSIISNEEIKNQFKKEHLFFCEIQELIQAAKFDIYKVAHMHELVHLCVKLCFHVNSPTFEKVFLQSPTIFQQKALAGDLLSLQQPNCAPKLIRMLLGLEAIVIESTPPPPSTLQLIGNFFGRSTATPSPAAYLEEYRLENYNKCKARYIQHFTYLPAPENQNILN